MPYGFTETLSLFSQEIKRLDPFEEYSFSAFGATPNLMAQFLIGTYITLWVN